MPSKRTHVESSDTSARGMYIRISLDAMTWNGWIATSNAAASPTRYEKSVRPNHHVSVTATTPTNSDRILAVRMLSPKTSSHQDSTM
ncbi:MAG: hypothetical protein QN135_02395 [Armatimonadota bacterium]|nr:hypothetical protein [Armatimonadota bacterium]